MPLKVEEAQFTSDHKIVTAGVSIVISVNAICCFQLSDDPS